MSKVSYPLRESPYLSGRRSIPFVAVAEDALPAADCEALVARIEAGAPAAAPIIMNGREVSAPGVRNNDRVIFDDPTLAAALYARTGTLAPAELAGGRRVGYNERFRGYRYRPGQRFAPHFDGAFYRPETPDGREGSVLTLLLYLNDGFSGGETTLCDYEVVVRPRRGTIFLFEHAMLHEGCAVTDGTKYVLRTDVMYHFARQSPRSDSPG
jgi:predicted 2-oxoglutarate/Fe(II)-dependent dioxygenase YbiX